MLIRKIFKDKKGDTIIEVMISIAVLSLILTVSYALSNRNSQYIQQSQERGEAQKISEEQLELLRGYLTPATPWNPGYKCFDAVHRQPTSLASACNFGTQDAGVGRYGVAIIPPSAAAPYTYTVHTTWSSLTGTTPQSLDLSYKLPDTALAHASFHPACSDSVDNDGDGLVDMADPGCSGASDNDEYNPPPTACNDGADNDGDGLVDLSDPGCSGPTDNNEFNPPACSDGADNDGDSKVDMADPGCSGASDNDEYNPTGPCYKAICP